MPGIVSGLNSALGAIGANSRFFRATSNNVANVETAGFRAERTRFSTQELGGTRATSLIDPSATSLLQAGGGPGALSAEGSSFLLLRDPSNPDGLALTKTADFQPDVAGVLVDAQGRQLLGFPTDANGDVSPAGRDQIGDLRPVQLPSGTTAVPTTAIGFGANLPASAAIGSSFQATTSVVDSLGREQALTATFTKTGVNSFDLGFALDPAQGSVAAPAGSVSVDFDGAGRLSTIAGSGTPGAPASVDLTLDFSTSGGASQTVSFGLGAFGGGALSQFAAPFAVTANSGNGSAASAITGFSVAADGLVSGSTENGGSVPLFQLASGTVPAPTQLGGQAGALTVSTGSGDLVIGQPGQAGFGAIGGGLSASTVDIATELSNLTVGSAAYKAALKVAQTGDELLESIIDIKR